MKVTTQGLKRDLNTSREKKNRSHTEAWESEWHCSAQYQHWTLEDSGRGLQNSEENDFNIDL